MQFVQPLQGNEEFGALSHNLKCLPHRLKICNILSGQLGSNLLKMTDSVFSVQTLTTMKANFSTYLYHCGVLTAAQ